MSYVEPKTALSADDCYFYHRMDLPGVDEKPWEWDLRGDEASYLGGFDFAGKRVLEFGAANGGLTFWMEAQGAEVVGVDLSPDMEKHSWDVIWKPGMDAAAVYSSLSEKMARLNNGWFYAREQLGGRARLVHATAYNAPPEIGIFDVVTFGSILLHLRDPLGALEQGLRFTRDCVIITDRHLAADADQPIARLAAARKKNTWWHVSPELYRQYLRAIGFKVERLTTGMFRHVNQPVELFTIVARRAG
jgi:hypothetical protein